MIVIIKNVYTRKEIIHKVILEIRGFMKLYKNPVHNIDDFYLSEIIFADARCLLSVGVINDRHFLLLYNIICRMLNNMSDSMQIEGDV